MTFREALIPNIPQMQVVRNSVKENALSNPDLVTDDDCVEFLTKRGKGWLCHCRFTRQQYLGFIFTPGF